MKADDKLAGRPPLVSLLKAFLFLNLAWPPLYGIFAIFTSEKKLLNPDEGGLFWIRIVMMAAMAAFALWLLLLVSRIASRWLRKDAGVFAGEEGFLFAVPRARLLRPTVSVDPVEVPREALRGTSFTVSDKSALSILTDARPVEIPSGTFAVGGYELEAAIRKAAGGALPPVEPQKVWTAKPAVRAAMVAIGLVLLVGAMALGVAVAMSRNEKAMNSATKISAPFFIAGIALIALSFVYKGKIVLDSRGLFYERDGKLSHLSPEALAAGNVRCATEPISLGLWSNLTIDSGGGRNPVCRMRFNRIMGLGFPLRQIEETVNKARGKSS